MIVCKAAKLKQRFEDLELERPANTLGVQNFWVSLFSLGELSLEELDATTKTWSLKQLSRFLDTNIVIFRNPQVYIDMIGWPVGYRTFEIEKNNR